MLCALFPPLETKECRVFYFYPPQPPNRVQRLTGAFKKIPAFHQCAYFTSFKSILISFVTSVKVNRNNWKGDR